MLRLRLYRNRTFGPQFVRMMREIMMNMVSTSRTARTTSPEGNKKENEICVEVMKTNKPKNGDQQPLLSAKAGSMLLIPLCAASEQRTVSDTRSASTDMTERMTQPNLLTIYGNTFVKHTVDANKRITNHNDKQSSK